MQIQRFQVMSCSVCGLKIRVSRHKPTLGSAMSCGRKFSASVVNAAIVNRNSKGLYTCKRTKRFMLQCKLIAKTIACCSMVRIWCSANCVHICWCNNGLCAVYHSNVNLFCSMVSAQARWQGLQTKPGIPLAGCKTQKISPRCLVHETAA